MDTPAIITTVLSLVVVFLFAVQKFSHQIQRVAGDRLKSMLNNWTSTPIKGAASGAIITGIIQSSTATSVILVGLVNAGVLNATNAISVIVGANIGTTITVQLLALNMVYVAPLIVIGGFILYHTHSRFKKYGKAVFYFGIMFLSLFIISNIITPLKDNIELQGILSNVNNLYAAILIGIVVTPILQSSSVFTGLILILASQGLINLPASIGFMLGANIGTPLTAIVASSSASFEAKKVAMAHWLFNLGGVILLLPFFNIFIYILRIISDNEVQQIVNAHFLFNVIASIVCLVFFERFKKIVEFVTRSLYKN